MTVPRPPDLAGARRVLAASWPVLIFLALVIAGHIFSAFYVSIGNQMLMTLIAVLGYNVLFGNAGQVSLGAGAFLGIGAFAATGASLGLGFPFLLSVLAAGIFCLVVGVIVAIPSLRLASHYLIFSTLALNFIAFYVLGQIQSNPSGWTLPSASVFGYNMGTDPFSWIPFNAAVVVLTAWLLRNLLRGRAGRAWTAIREHSGAAGIMGIRVMSWRVGAFALSSFLFGISGAIAAYYLQQVSADNYTLDISITYAVIVLVGGLGSMLGSVLGTVIVVGLPYLLQQLTNSSLFNFLGPNFVGTGQAYLSLIVYGLLVVVLLMLEPGGLAAGVIRLYRFARRIATAAPEADARPSGPVRADAVQLGTGAGVPVLSVRDLVVSYGNADPAVRHASLDLYQGTIALILGLNGAGKTSLLRGIAGFGPGEHARVRVRQLDFDGRDCRRGAAVGRHTRVAFVPERDKVFGTLSVEANLRLCTRHRGQRDEVYRLIREVFPRLAAIDWRRPAGALSGGERQMLALGMALARSPACLVLDEPSLGLAPVAIKQLAASLIRLRDEQSLTILAADQNASLGLEIADALAIIARGVITDSGPRGEWDYDRIRRAYLADAVESPDPGPAGLSRSSP